MRCMALSALGFFFAGGINNAYALPVSPVPTVMAAPECGARWHVSPSCPQGRDGDGRFLSAPVPDRA